jgi:DNA-binding transcriptional regulator YdaS (Cro superfamily)
MKLSDWFAIPNADGSRRRKDDFAAAIGVTPQIISAYCNDRIWPGRERMEAIARETGGEVTANDFVSVPDDIASDCTS